MSTQHEDTGMRTLRFVAGRLLGMVVVLLIIALISYLIFYLLPANPAQLSCGRPCTPQRLAQAEAFMGYDKPWWAQFFGFLGGLLVGRTFGTGQVVIQCAAPCFGYSFRLNESVTQLIVDRAPVTFSIAIGAAVLWLILGVGTGVVSALRRGTLLDRGLTTLSVAGVSAPAYLVGLLGILLFGFTLNMVPIGGYVPLTQSPIDWLWHLILPWVVLALLQAAIYTRLTRGQMLDVLGEDYIRTARAKGLTERRVVGRHALRNVLIPVATVFGLDLGTPARRGGADREGVRHAGPRRPAVGRGGQPRSAGAGRGHPVLGFLDHRGQFRGRHQLRLARSPREDRCPVTVRRPQTTKRREERLMNMPFDRLRARSADRLKARKGVAVALAAGLLLLAGCNANPAQSSNTQTQAATKGGDLTVLTSSTQLNFDPAKSQSLAITSLGLVLRRLTSWQTSPDATTKPIPDLATDTGRASDGGKTWTYTLKDGLKYDDGTRDHQPGHQVRRRTLVRGAALGWPELSQVAAGRRGGLQGPLRRQRAVLDRNSRREDDHLPPERAVRRLALDRLDGCVRASAEGQGHQPGHLRQ